MSEPSENANGLWRFLFENLPVRGALVRIGAEWCDLLSHRPYPDVVRQLLGEAMAAGPLLASTLKHKGQLTLQAEGKGQIKLLLVQINQKLEMRGMARHDSVVDSEDLALLGTGQLGLIVEPEHSSQHYQALVPLIGRRLQESLVHYFQQSEQLPSWIMLEAGESSITGLLLQRMPANATDSDDVQEGWRRLGLLADTLQPKELMTLPALELLRRLFQQDTMQIFEPQAVHLSCRCNHGRISEMLLSLGRKEVDEILREQGKVKIECGFCGQSYAYSMAEIVQLFKCDTEVHSPADSLH